MKSFIFFSVLIVATLAAEDPHGIQAAFDKCHPPGEAEPPHPDVEPKAEEPHDHHHHGDPARHFEILKCAAKELGLIDSEGKVNEAGVRNHVEHVVTDPEKATEIVKICAEDKPTTDATLKHVWKCLHKKHIFVHPHPEHNHSDESGSSESEEHHHKHHHHHNKTEE